MATDYFYAYGIRIGGRTLEEWLRELPAGTYAAYLETDTTVKDFPVTLKPGVHIAVTVLDEIRQTGTSAAAVITVPAAAAADGKAHIVLADITADTIAYTETGAGGGGSDIEIVNDLTTGGTDKALSAEMGKHLNGYKLDADGSNSTSDTLDNIIAKTPIGSVAIQEGEYILRSSNTYGRWRTTPISFVWNYIKAKADAIYAKINHTHTKSQITDFPTLATVATSGSYNDLTNKPTIPTAVTVDSSLSTTSTNPVQNKVITAALNGKQATLVNGTTIKTINGSSVLGAGDIETADTKVTAIALTTDSAGAVTGGTATLSDGTQVQITVTQHTV